MHVYAHARAAFTRTCACACTVDIFLQETGIRALMAMIKVDAPAVKALGAPKVVQALQQYRAHAIVMHEHACNTRHEHVYMHVATPG